jgi:hypothetical protein
MSSSSITTSHASETNTLSSDLSSYNMTQRNQWVPSNGCLIRRPSERFTDSPRSLFQTLLAWHYWSDLATNEKGESLIECFHMYGTGEFDSSNEVLGADITVRRVFLDSSRNHDRSWLLSVTRIDTQDQLSVSSYQNLTGCYQCRGLYPSVLERSPQLSTGELTLEAEEARQDHEELLRATRAKKSKKSLLNLD